MESEIMSEKMQPVPLAKSYLLLNHGPVTLVTSASAGRENIMAAAWVMPLDFDPPKVLLVLDRQTQTREFVNATGQFALNLPCQAIADKVLAAGRHSGRDGDKFVMTGLETIPASRIDVPLVKGCVGWLECKVIPETVNQNRYDLFIAEVVAAWADPEVFSNGRWHFSDPNRRTIHYQAGGSFFVTGGTIEFPDDLE